MDKLKMWCNYQQHSYYIHYSSHFINLKIAVAVPLTWMHPPAQKGLREHSITSAEIRTFELSPWLFWHLGIFPLLTIIQYIYIWFIHGVSPDLRTPNPSILPRPVRPRPPPAWDIGSSSPRCEHPAGRELFGCWEMVLGLDGLVNYW
jgi:hypothetical protein